METLAALSNSGQHPLPLSIRRQDEIGLLVGSFNRLLEILGNRETALRKVNYSKRPSWNSVHSQIVVLDHSGVIVAVNEAWQAAFALKMGIIPEIRQDSRESALTI